MNDNSHKTAMSRKKPSAPLKHLESLDLLKGEILDYGCGRGLDAKYLNCDSYDPYYQPNFPTQLYDTILCTYVFNVINDAERVKTLQKMRKLLKPNGKIYVTVRNDVKSDFVTTRKTTQYKVDMDFPLVEKTKSHFKIYQIDY